MQRLNLTLLIDGKYQRTIRRVHEETDHVVNLLDEVGIGRRFGGVEPMWLEAKGTPDSANGHGVQPRLLGHQGRRPMRSLVPVLAQCPLDHLGDFVAVDRRWSAGSKGIRTGPPAFGRSPE